MGPPLSDLSTELPAACKTGNPFVLFSVKCCTHAFARLIISVAFSARIGYLSIAFPFDNYDDPRCMKCIRGGTVRLVCSQNCKDHVINCSIASILHECISPRVARGKTKGNKNKSATSKLQISNLPKLGISSRDFYRVREESKSSLLYHSDNWLSFAGSSSRMAVMQLINLGITQVLVKLLVNLQHADSISSEVLTQEVLWLLGQVRQSLVPLTQFRST